uniref:Uncharacterized protein n=1 Tax=Opuntia streptacantha TaxID=393608 RepID=A0A7C9EH14_OPUST
MSDPQMRQRTDEETRCRKLPIGGGNKVSVPVPVTVTVPARQLRLVQGKFGNGIQRKWEQLDVVYDQMKLGDQIEALFEADFQIPKLFALNLKRLRPIWSQNRV